MNGFKQNDMGNRLSDPIEFVTGVGPKTVPAFKTKGIETIGDLLFYLPRKYDDFSHIVPIRNIKPGQVSIKAKITNAKTRRGRRGLSITEALASDETDSVKLVWFNQPYRANGIKSGETYFISGNYKLSNHQYSIINPSVELSSEVPLSSARIVPVYPESKDLKSTQLRKVIGAVIDQTSFLEDPMPKYVVDNLLLLNYSEAIRQVHFPDSIESLDSATRRLKFDGLFPLLLANELSQRERKSVHSLKVKFKAPLAQMFVSKLPFKLTDDQKRVIWQIYQDMEKDMPMNRLVEGDVGSGKTVVAVMAAVMAMSEDYKVAFMAPTELLAKQHASTVKKLLEPLGLSESLILLTGSMSAKDKKVAVANANNNQGCFVVGTHSLLTSGIDWYDLALLIIDEQHRFGVDQRMEIQKQAGHIPHFLSTTATPIPRSLALTVLSDLDLSRLKSMPDSRQPIKTELVPPSDFLRFLAFLRSEIKAGRQAYIVAPYIHDKDSQANISAESIEKELAVKLKGIKVALIHGQLSSTEQESIMTDFLNGKTKVLVATTVIEVGVDVPNATVMAIYGPERFGLAQLHQLRGRVGRGVHKSTCFLMLSDAMEPLPRLRQFAKILDGFELSELDLKIRGPGAVYGKLQHGKGAAELLTLDDPELITTARRAVELFFEKGEKLLKYKRLSQMVHEARQLTYLN